MQKYDQIVANQRSFFRSEATKSISFRIEQLKKLKAVLQKNEDLLMKAIHQDFHKSEFDTYSNELGLVYTDINEAIKKVKHWSKTKRVGTNLINFPAKSYIIPEPLGVALVIGAWNYPYQLAFAPIVAALAAGCTVVLKPSELPSNTSRAMAQVINENFNANYLTVVEGGVQETTSILEQRFDKIFFTGSSKVGKIVYQAAAKHLTPVTLELGGKSPAFITESCHIKMTAKRLVWAKFLNAGQTCIAPDYLLVHRSIKKEFTEAIIAEIKASQFSLENENYVQIVNEQNVQRLIQLIDPQKVIYGGTYDLEKRVIEPTVIDNVTYQDKIMQEEIFGPLLPLIEYTDISEAIAYVKEGEKPLSCYVFTKDAATKKRILKEISFGGGGINEAIMHITTSKLPFGGVGSSGMGSYHGEAGFKTFSHFKSILDKPTWFELNLKYSPRTNTKLNLIKKIIR